MKYHDIFFSTAFIKDTMTIEDDGYEQYRPTPGYVVTKDDEMVIAIGCDGRSSVLVIFGEDTTSVNIDEDMDIRIFKEVV